MMVMTAKVELKKVIFLLAAVAGVILAIILLAGGTETAETSAPTVPTNDARVAFLKEFGWEVTTSPKESGQVRIPEKSSDVFDRYNALQKDQGYDLQKYAGKKVMRYVYEIKNYPDAKAPVYATILVYKNKIIGGDITDTAAGGRMRGFPKPSVSEIPGPATAAPSQETTEDSGG